MTRRERWPAWAATLVAGAACLLCFLSLVPFSLDLLFMWTGTLKETTRVAIVATIVVVVPYVATRLTYRGLRWVRVDDGVRRCGVCHYDLTGNVSGTCPECGTPTEQQPDPPRCGGIQ